MESIGIALPVPVGHHILAKPMVTEARYGNIVIPDSRKGDEDVASMVAEVVSLGPDCYLDIERFPSGPRCQPGDIILMKSMAGVRFMHGAGPEKVEYRIINDDTPLAIVGNPSMVGRAY